MKNIRQRSFLFSIFSKKPTNLIKELKYTLYIQFLTPPPPFPTVKKACNYIVHMHYSAMSRFPFSFFSIINGIPA